VAMRRDHGDLCRRHPARQRRHGGR
jgi:hypothetical protein